MSDERFLELVPLAALGALDGEERAAFEAALASSPVLQRELAAFKEAAGQIGAGTPPLAPASAVRERVMRATQPAGAPVSRRAQQPAAPRASWLVPALAAALVGSVALGLLQTRRLVAERAAALADANEARQQADRARAEADALREALAREVAFRDLVTLPETRVASLAGLAAAPQARARIVWHQTRQEAVLVATGLTPAPPGKAYELWIIAKAAPVPAGVFQVDARGRAVFRLPPGLSYLDVKTFAITVEPEAGTLAPTGPMVLAGAVS
jgi:hypothetical protein